VDLIRNGQHSSLLRHDNNYDRKKLIAQAQGVNCTDKAKKSLITFSTELKIVLENYTLIKRNFGREKEEFSRVERIDPDPDEETAPGNMTGDPEASELPVELAGSEMEVDEVVFPAKTKSFEKSENCFSVSKFFCRSNDFQPDWNNLEVPMLSIFVAVAAVKS
jgi:hypothetical protein